MSYIKKTKIALVHDDFIQFGGAERLFFEVIKYFSKDSSLEVVVFSSLISSEWKGIFAKNNISYQESFLAKIPFCYKIHKLFFIFDLFYLGFSDFDFTDFQIVISSSTRFGHFLITKPTTYHISYINSPARALWDEKKYFHGKFFLHCLVKNTLPSKRIYDFYSHTFADLLISNSKNIKNKVLKIYHRKSMVLFPFYNLQKPKISKKRGNYFVLISRLVSWKRLDYVIDSFNKSEMELLVIGDGPELEGYKKVSKVNIKYLGYASEEDKFVYLAQARGLIFPQVEDFGITILEALALDTPIIYLNKGGAKEILNFKVGIPFEFQQVFSLDEALEKVDNFVFDIRERDVILEKYSSEKFLGFLSRLIQKVQITVRI